MEALHEREEYPETYDQPESSDVVLDEAVVRRITPTAQRWRARRSSIRNCGKSGFKRGRVSPEYCKCTSIPEKNKLMASFLGGVPTQEGISRHSYDAYFDGKDFYYSLQLFKNLLVYEEMDTILRLGAHANACFKKWQTSYIFVSSCLVEATHLESAIFKIADLHRAAISGGTVFK